MVVACANTEFNKTTQNISFAYYNENNDLNPNNLAFMNTESVWICTDSRGKLIRFSEEGRFLGGYGNNSKSEYSTDLYNPNAITPNPITDPSNPFKYRFMVASEWGFDTGLKMFSPVIAIPEIQVFEKADNEEIKVTFPTSGKWTSVEKALGIGLLSVKINGTLVPQSVWESQIAPTDFNNLPSGQGNPLEGYPNEFNMATTYLARGWNTIEITIRMPRTGESPLDVKQTARFYWLPSNYSPTAVTGDLASMSLSPYANDEIYIYKPITVGGIGVMIANRDVIFNEFGNLFFDTNSSLSIQTYTNNLFSNFKFLSNSKLSLNEGAFICASSSNAMNIEGNIGINKNVFLDENIRIGINSLLGVSTNCSSACVFRNEFKNPTNQLSYNLVNNSILKTIAGIVNMQPSYYDGIRFEMVKYDSYKGTNTVAGSLASREFTSTISGVQTITSYPNFILEPCSKYELSVTQGCNSYNGNQQLSWFTNNNTKIIILTAPTVTLSPQIDICERIRTQTLTGFNPLPSIGFANSTAAGYAFWKLASVTSGLTLNPSGVLRFNAGVPRSQPYLAKYTFTDLLGCTVDKSTNITIWTVPVRPVVTTNSPICEYDNLYVHVINATNSGYNYKIAGPYMNDIDFVSEMGNIAQILNVSTLYAGVYTTTSSNYGCTSNPRLTTVRINSLPGLNIGIPLEVCLRTPRFVLTAQPNGGTFTGVGVQKIGTRYFFIASVAGFGVHNITYNYTSPATKCSNAISKNITVGPIITLGVSEKICAGEVPFFPFVVSPLGGVWKNGAIALQNNLFTPTGANLGEHLLTYNFTSPSGCVNSASKTITVVGLPSSPTASNSGAVCENGNVILSASSITAASYQWTNAATGYSSTIQNSTITGIATTQAGAYLVRAFKDGCFSPTTPSAITLVTVNSLPTITILTTSSLCFNGSALNVATIVSPLGGVWTGTGMVGNYFEPATSLVGINKIDYSYIDSKGCQGFKSTNITVLPAPVVEILTSTPQTVCATNFTVANLIANPTGNSYPGPFSFQWAKNGNAISTATGQSLSTAESGIYTISVTGLCGMASQSFPLSIKSGFEWIGANTNWTDTKNWCGGIMPTATDVAIINTAPNYPYITVPVELKSIIIGVGAKIDNANTITIREQIINNGILNSFGKIDFVGNTVKTILGIGIIKTKDADIDGVLQMFTHLSITGTLTLKSNTTLHTEDKLTLHSDNQGTGRIATIPSSSTILGMCSVQRWIPAKRANRYLASPVIGSTIKQFQSKMFVTGPGQTINGFDAGSSFPTVSLNNENAQGNLNFGFVPAPNINTLLEIGKGYLVLVRGPRETSGLQPSSAIPTKPVTLSFKGGIQQGDFNFNLSYSVSNPPIMSTDGFNLIGNPYPSQIDWDNHIGWTKINVANAIYIWDPIIATSGYGVMFSYVNGISSPNSANANIIASSQGFYVTANTANPFLQINENAKSDYPHNAFFRKESTSNFFRLHLNVSNRTDEAVIGFNENATPNFDTQFDAQKAILMQDDSLVLSSLSVDNKNLCINMLPNIDTNSTVIPLVIKSNFNGLHTLNFSELHQLESNIRLYLHDNLRNITKPMYENTKAKFYNHPDSSQNGVIHRFSIIATKSNHNSRKEFETQTPSESNILIFPNPVGKSKTLYIKTPNEQDAKATIAIFNLNGVVILKKTYNPEQSNQTLALDLGNIPSGIYIVEVKSKNKKKIE